MKMKRLISFFCVTICNYFIHIMERMDSCGRNALYAW